MPAMGAAVAEVSMQVCHTVPLSGPVSPDAGSHPTVTEVAVRPVTAIPVTLGQGGNKSIIKSSIKA